MLEHPHGTGLAGAPAWALQLSRRGKSAEQPVLSAHLRGCLWHRQDRGWGLGAHLLFLRALAVVHTGADCQAKAAAQELGNWSSQRCPQHSHLLNQ